MSIIDKVVAAVTSGSEETLFISCNGEAWAFRMLWLNMADTMRLRSCESRFNLVMNNG
jgi:hypothetical protein